MMIVLKKGGNRNERDHGTSILRVFVASGAFLLLGLVVAVIFSQNGKTSDNYVVYTGKRKKAPQKVFKEDRKSVV